MNSIEYSWDRCWSSIGAQGKGKALMQMLLNAYQERHRKYHTEQHLKECLSLFSEHIEWVEYPGEVEIALWFHDAIYDVKASNNEQRSAEFASEQLANAGVESEAINRISSHILATKHNARAEGNDQQILVDIDLSILGASESRFAQYEEQVRQEYGFVPGFIFRSKRRKLLQALLARESIYESDVFRDRFEHQARLNIKKSISALA